jgi:type IV pilus assembly protein PilM
MLVLIAAAKKDFLNQRLKLLEELGVRVDGVDVDSLALINAFTFNYPQTDKTKTIALLNIGASFSNLSILEGSLPRLSRDIHIAGNNFTQKIADTLSLDFNSAQSLKINPQQEQAGKITPAFEAILSQLAAEIRTSFDYYESQSASSVGKIFLSGGGSLFAGLKEGLANVLGTEVDYWDPLKQITPAGNLDLSAISGNAARFAVAVGLAL